MPATSAEHPSRRTSPPGWFKLALGVTFLGLFLQHISPLLHVMHERAEEAAAVSQDSRGSSNDSLPRHHGHHDESKCVFCQTAMHGKLFTSVSPIPVAVALAEQRAIALAPSQPRTSPSILSPATPRAPPAL